MKSSVTSVIASVVLLAAVVQQLTDAVAVPKKAQRQQSQETCGEMNSQWIDTMWSAYKEKFDRSYEPNEDSVRKQLFASNVWQQAKHNIELDLGLHSYQKGLNDFSDWTEDELNVLYGGIPPYTGRRSSGDE